MKRIAIIGSGMAGLAAGWICRRAGCEVVLYEAQAGRGMDAHALYVDTPTGPGLIDAPLRVMSPHAWRSVLALCNELGIDTFEVDTFAAFTWLGGRTWLRNTKLRLGHRVVPFIGTPRFINPSSIAVGAGLMRLVYAAPASEGVTLDQFARRTGLPDAFYRGFLLPILSTVCTCDEATLRAWPARDLMETFRRIHFGRSLLRVRGGTPALVDRLACDLELRAPERVTHVTEVPGGVAVATASGHKDTFDVVFVATQANQTSFLDEVQYARERALLGRFRYDAGSLVVHTDARVMPPRRDDWTALSYLVHRNLSAYMFSVWVNAVEPTLVDAAPVFQTWQTPETPLVPDPEHVLKSVYLQRAVVDGDTVAALDELTRLHDEPDRKVFFCGSWAAVGVPLLESALRSAIQVSGRVGAPSPWAPA